MSEIDVRCAVCGALNKKAVLTRTSSFGPPDLDLRPQGPARWALEFQVQRCDACGYCASSIGQAPPQARAVVESVVYRDVLQRSKLPSLARSFFCAALVHEGSGELETSAWKFLEAAWACDDRRARAQARICRQRAAEMFQRTLETGETTQPSAVVHTLVAELWRRAGQFDEALAACAAAEAELDPVTDVALEEDERAGTATVAAFVRNLAIAGDDDGRTCAEAFADDDE